MRRSKHQPTQRVNKERKNTTDQLIQAPLPTPPAPAPVVQAPPAPTPQPPAPTPPAPQPAPAGGWNVTGDPGRDLLQAQLSAKGVSPDSPAYTILTATGDPSVLHALLISKGVSPAEAQAAAATAAHYVKADLSSAAAATTSFNSWLDADGRGGRAALDAAVAEAQRHATPAEARWLQQSLALGGFAAKAAASALFNRSKPAQPAPAAPSGVRGTPGAGTGAQPVTPREYLVQGRALAAAGIQPGDPAFRQLESAYALWKSGVRK